MIRLSFRVIIERLVKLVTEAGSNSKTSLWSIANSTKLVALVRGQSSSDPPFLFQGD
ncbi:conserved hypothetical protein [Ricinus communis]|uniref:Uncharacterized protein n=1 Tax=Ricinus communis TaxID=3988 RepID=B9RNN0_RICCO|nr:conserved hypothetical protein [Ricinus communis]